MDHAQLEFFRQVVEAAPDGVVMVDRQGKILVYNHAARKLAGRENTRMLGQNMADLGPEAWADMRLIVDNGRVQRRQKVFLGRNTIIANRAPVHLDGRIAGVLSIFRDMSEYENLAKELAAYKELSEQLDVIIESSHDGMWISDAQGKVIKVNAASARRTGLDAEELVGRNVQELVDEGYFDRSATLEVLRRRAPVTFVQNMRDGGQSLVTGTPVFNEKGEVRLVVINDRDLTSIHKLQAELEESRARTKQYRSELIRTQKSRELDSRLVIRSVPMRRVLDTAIRVARTDSSVLIQGESGVGKGLLAKVIHESSSRQEGPLVRVDCGAIPGSLIEAELFGYEKGAFTGALDQGKPGYFEMAQGGTLFLDEVGELPLNVQAKLLRFLEDKDVVRVGSTEPRRIDVRILAATHRDLQEMVAQKTFRKDLFFRLSVVPLVIPPLRERLDDIAPLVSFFLSQFAKKVSTPKTVAPEVVECLRGYSFPGNIRELANLMEQLVVLSPGPRIDLEDLSPAVRDPGARPVIPGSQDEMNLARAVEAVERDVITRALQTFGSQRKAAVRLGINHSTLSRKIARYGISVAN